MRRLPLLLILSALGLVACSINVDKDANGKDKNVEIKTPVGGLTVNKGDATAADVGLAAYPGASLVKSDNDDSAHVAMNFPGFSMSVVAAKYASDDARPKLLDFYRKELARYGKVIECQSDGGSDVNVNKNSGDQDLSRPVDCSNGGGRVNIQIHGKNKGAELGDRITLKVGVQGDQRDVSLRNKDGKTFIDLVRVRVSTDKKPANPA